MEIKFNIKTDSSDMLWKQVRNQIAEHIISHNVPVGTKLPGVDDVAAQAGVSLKTGERAFQALIKDGICFRRPKKGTFVGCGYAAPTVRRICGLCANEEVEQLERDLVNGQIFHGIRLQASKVCDTFFLTGEPEEAIRCYLGQGGVELCGVIMVHWTDVASGIALAKKFPRVNFVFLNYLMDDFEITPKNVYGIFNDDFGGAFQLANYLLERNHKRFGVVSLDQVNCNYRRRIDGFCFAAQNAGVDIPTDRILSCPRNKDHYTQEDLSKVGFDLATELLSRPDAPTAIFAPNDNMAHGVLMAINKARTADQTEVVGYDVTASFRQHQEFTSVAVDFEGIGRMAIRLLTENTNCFSKMTFVNPQLLVKN